MTAAFASTYFIPMTASPLRRYRPCRMFALVCALGIAPLPLRAADVVVQPVSGGGFVVKDAGGANERLRVQESGAVSLPSIPTAPAQAQGVCMGNGGVLGPCSGAGSNAALPIGTVNETVRYDASNKLVANGLLQAFSDGGLWAGGTLGTGTIPTTGTGARMMWYPAKAAFRAGWVNTNVWDDANVGQYSVAMGENTQANGSHSVAMGGGSTAAGDYSVAIGLLSSASSVYSIAIGAQAASGGGGSVALGLRSQASQTGAVAIGQDVTADGANSVAIGSNAGSAGHSGSFIFHDACAIAGCPPFANTANNQFMVSASGGIVFWTGGSSVISAPPGGGTWTTSSDRNAKTAISRIDPRDVLQRVIALPLSTWQYKTQDAKYRHMGPMAQDFHAAFHLGESDKGIDVVDAEGVALAAIQGLYAQIQDRDAAIAALRSELAAQKTRVAELETLAEDMADMKAHLAALRRSTPAATTTAALYQP